MAVNGGGEVEFLALHMFHSDIKTVEEAKASDQYLDLLSVYASLHINESMLTPFQTGQILLNDSNDILPDYPIAGGNIFHFVYNLFDGPAETEIDVWFRVVSVKNIVINERKQGYTLQLISEDGWKNMHTCLQSAFKGEPSEIIEEIYTEHLNVGDKQLIVDKSLGNLKFVCPHWRPSQAIKWVEGKALSPENDMPSFFFYETMKGFRFISTDTLLDKEKNIVITDLMAQVETERPGGAIRKGFLYKIPGIPVQGSDGRPQSGTTGTESAQNVDDFRILERQPIGKDIIDGFIANKHITVDIFNKELITEEFYYHDDFGKFKRLASKKHYDAPREPIPTDLRITMSPKHEKLHTEGGTGDRTLYADDYGPWRRHITKQISDEVIDNFEVPGAPIIEAGRLLEFNYPAVRKVDDPSRVYNEKYSGLYIIRDVVHTFRPVVNTTTSYKVDMNIVKDGWNE